MSKRSREGRRKMDLRPKPHPVTAEYYSVCEICTADIEPGDEIIHIEGEWVHYDCAESEGWLT